MESTDKFNDTSLPSQEKFYSKLHFKNISDEEYKHAKKVWDHFKFINIGQYYDLYVQADTAQLSDVLTEKSIRGGLTQAIEKHAAANNKYLPNFDKSKDSTFLQYLDANNLY